MLRSWVPAPAGHVPAFALWRWLEREAALRDPRG